MLTVDIYFLLSNQSARKVLFACLENTNKLYLYFQINGNTLCLIGFHENDGWAYLVVCKNEKDASALIFLLFKILYIYIFLVRTYFKKIK